MEYTLCHQRHTTSSHLYLRLSAHLLLRKPMHSRLFYRTPAPLPFFHAFPNSNIFFVYFPRRSFAHVCLQGISFWLSPSSALDVALYLGTGSGKCSNTLLNVCKPLIPILPLRTDVRLKSTRDVYFTLYDIFTNNPSRYARTLSSFSFYFSVSQYVHFHFYIYE